VVKLWEGVRHRLQSTWAAIKRIPRSIRPDTRISRKEVEGLFPLEKKCVHCGGWHQIACPRVKSLKMVGDNPSEVEFWPDKQWPKDQIIWPWDLAKMIKEGDEPAAPTVAVVQADYADFLEWKRQTEEGIRRIK
jgi:hypothetical protein